MNGLISKKTGLVVMALTAGLAVHADTLFSNTNATSTFGFSSGGNGNQIGSQVGLADDGYGAILTGFSFELYARNVDSSLASYTISLYANDGATVNGYASPSTELWTSSYTFGTADLSTGMLVSYGSSDLNSVQVPSTFTWVISFSDLGSGDAGVNYTAENPAVGGLYSDVWVNDGAGWGLDVAEDGSNINFLSSFEGTVLTTPEPSSIALLSLGSASLLFWRRRSARCSK